MTLRRKAAEARMLVRCLLAVAAIGHVPMACATDFVRRYATNNVLTLEQEIAALDIARRHGVTNVESISTSIYVPLRFSSVVVKETDRVKGRRVSYRAVSLDYVRRVDIEGTILTNKVPAKGFLGFNSLSEKKLTVLYVAGRSNRVELQEGISIERAELMLSRVQEVRDILQFFEPPEFYARNRGQGSSRDIGLDNPKALFVPRSDGVCGSYKAAYPSRSDRTLTYLVHFVFEEDSLIILRVSGMYACP